MVLQLNLNFSIIGRRREVPTIPVEVLPVLSLFYAAVNPHFFQLTPPCVQCALSRQKIGRTKEERKYYGFEKLSAYQFRRRKR